MLNVLPNDETLHDTSHRSWPRWALELNQTPGEFLVAYSDLVRANLNDAFEGAEKVLWQTRR